MLYVKLLSGRSPSKINKVIPLLKTDDKPNDFNKVGTLIIRHFLSLTEQDEQR